MKKEINITEVFNLLKESKEALINRDAIECYNNLGHVKCECTICKINLFIKKYEE